jgi:hypothetical protein
VRLLVDHVPLPAVARALALTGHDVIHVRDIGMASSTDAEIMQLAVQDRPGQGSAETDCGAILAESSAERPSVIPLRRGVPRDPGAARADCRWRVPPPPRASPESEGGSDCLQGMLRVRRVVAHTDQGCLTALVPLSRH